MIVDSILPRAEYGPNDHREDVPCLYTILVQSLSGPHFYQPQLKSYPILTQFKRNPCLSH